MDVSFIIINYNTWHYLEPCLESIQRYVKGLSYEIIVVDNASNDNSIKLIQQNYPSIKLKLNEKNMGFAKANNQAVEIANGDYLFLLNADTVLLNGGIRKAVEYMKKKRISVLGPKLLNKDGTLQKSFDPKNTLNKYISDLYSLAFPFRRLLERFRNKTIEIPVTPCPMGFLLGAALIIDMKTVQKLGLFDESYFFTCEERDFCLKILRAHQKIVYFPEFHITHYGGGGDPHSTFHLLNWAKGSYTFAKNYGSIFSLILIKAGFSFYFINTAIIIFIKSTFFQYKKMTHIARKFFYLFLWSIGCLDEEKLI